VAKEGFGKLSQTDLRECQAELAEALQQNEIV